MSTSMKFTRKLWFFIALFQFLFAMGLLFAGLCMVKDGKTGSPGISASDLYLSKRPKSKERQAETKTFTFPGALFGW